MKYHFRRGVQLDKKRPTWLLWTLLFIGILGSGYAGVNYLSPKLVSMPLSAKASPDATMQKMQSSQPSEQPHIYVPQINVDLSLSSERADHAAWQKEPSSLDSEEGLIVLRANYFKLGVTPWQTRENSPFYNLDKLQTGDEIYLDYKGKRHAYKITETNQSDYQHVDTSKKHLILVPISEAGEAARSTIVIAESKGVVVSKGSASD